MMYRRTHRNITWIDLENPSASEVRPLVEEFGIHPLVADELLNPSLKPKVDFYGNSIYCILHFPARRHSHQGGRPDQEIDFVIGKDFLITTHYDSIDPLHKFSKVFEVNSTLDRTNIGEHAGFLFYYMTKKLYRALHHELEQVDIDLRQIEQAIFKGKEREMVLELSKAAHDILAMKRSLSLHGDVLASLRRAAARLFDPEYDFYLRDIESEFTKVEYSVRGSMDYLGELRSTNDSLLTTKQNEIGLTLTVMAFMILPASFIAALFSMQVKSLPIVGTPHDFWRILALMAALAGTFWLIFKRKRWL